MDWDRIISENLDYRPFLSIRGRNLYFANSISAILQLDKLGEIRNLKDYKAAFTADAVRKINEAIIDSWPPNIDIVNVLKREAGDVSGLYIGDYSSEYITQAIVRHSIYANRILLIDPFIYPRSVRDEFNPILNPEQHRAQTLKTVNLWFALLPWIEAGIVSIIRPPSDFDHRLNWDSMQAQLKKLNESPELKKASEQSVNELADRHREDFHRRHLVLGAPNEYLKRKFEEMHLGNPGESVDEFLKAVRSERERDPDFLEPMTPNSDGQLLMMSSGASYPGATMTAGMTGSYLFTDIPLKWKEIELDRATHSAENKVWTPFAKALQEARLRFLNGLRLEHALQLRKEGRLESLRGFLRKVWKSASTEDQFESANAILLAEELGEQIRDAEQEWQKIDDDLVKIVRTEAAAGALASGPLIAAGHASFVAAAAVIAGGGALVWSTMKRYSFPDRFPAAFFMKIEESEKG